MAPSDTQLEYEQNIDWIPAKLDPPRASYESSNTIVEKIKELKLEEKVIGLVGLYNLPIPLYRAILKGLPNARFVEVPDLIARIRIVKSPEEMRFVEKAAELSDYAYEAMKETIKPGRKEYEIYAAVEHAIVSHGGSPPLPGIPPSHRTLLEGDTILIERDHPILWRLLRAVWTSLLHRQTSQTIGGYVRSLFGRLQPWR